MPPTNIKRKKSNRFTTTATTTDNSKSTKKKRIRTPPDTPTYIPGCIYRESPSGSSNENFLERPKIRWDRRTKGPTCRGVRFLRREGRSTVSAIDRTLPSSAGGPTRSRRRLRRDASRCDTARTRRVDRRSQLDRRSTFPEVYPSIISPRISRWFHLLRYPSDLKTNRNCN